MKPQTRAPNTGKKSDKEILRDRARALARTPEKHYEGRLIDLVLFRLGSETFGVATGYVREVFPSYDITQVPCTPAHVVGITSLRGEILAIVDLRVLFELEPGKEQRGSVLVLHSESMEFGILVDEVKGVGQVSEESIQTNMSIISGHRKEFLHGVTRDGLVILDVQRLLTDSRLAINEE